MSRLKLVLFALREMSAMGYHMAGSGLTGGEAQRLHAMAHMQLYFEAMDAVITRRDGA